MKKSNKLRQDLGNWTIIRAEPNPKRKGSAAAKTYAKMVRVIKLKKMIPIAELNKTTDYSAAHFRWDLAHKFLTVRKLGIRRRRT